VPDEEITTRMSYWDTRQNALVPFSECRFSTSCKGQCNFKIRADAEHYAIRFLQDYGKKITDVKTLQGYLLKINEWLITKQGFNEVTMDQRLPNCLKIRLLRKALLEKEFSLSAGQANKLLEIVLKDANIN